MTKPTNYATAERMDECDRQAFADAALAVIGPQAAFDAIAALMRKRYALGPMDTISTDGTITRPKLEEPAKTAGEE